jgi:hypothetical protein
MSRTADFFVWNGEGWEFIQLEEGVPRQFNRWDETDEGFDASGEIYMFDGETVECQWVSYGRDCDGRLQRTGIRFCALDKLQARPALDRDRNLLPFKVPEWSDEPVRQRDFRAEAAGY